MKKKILFRCDSNQEIGFGHLSRCLSIAEILKSDYMFDIEFAIQRDEDSIMKILSYDFKYKIIDEKKINNNKNKQTLSSIIQSSEIDILFLDLRNNICHKEIEILKKEGLVIASLDDSSDIRLISDLVFLPPLPQINNLNWDNFKGEFYIGWNWMPLKKDFLKKKKLTKQKSYLNFKSRKIKFLITMGGSDIKGFTISALNLLNKFVKLEKLNVEIKVILGTFFSYSEEIKKLKSSLDISFTEYRDVSNMHDFIAEADLGLISYGTTAYEFAVMRTQCFYFCLTEDHAMSAEEFQKNLFGKSFKYNDILNIDKLLPVFVDYINILNSKDIEFNKSFKQISGKGAENIAKVIDQKVKI